MKFFSLWLVINCLFTIHCISQIPNFGNDTLLDVGCWNLEWFGHSEYGPTNEQLQFENIKKVILETGVDVWGLSEVANTNTFNQLLSDLPQYDGVIATYNQTQKTALIYKKDLFELITHNHVLNSSHYNTDFTGRPPLEIALKTKTPLAIDTMYFIVIHLKAYSNQEAYNRRKTASIFLKNHYLDQYRKNVKTIVLGDWNDDVDISTYNQMETPFKNFLDDTSQYHFTTKQLSNQGKKSYAFSNGSMIDHILINQPLFANYLSTTTQVLDIMPTYISNFSHNTSDHYPVISSFTWKKEDELQLLNQKINPIYVYKDFVSDKLIIKGDGIENVKLFTIDGLMIGDFANIHGQIEIPLNELSKGMLILHCYSQYGITNLKYVH